jgi:hypothetical protein
MFTKQKMKRGLWYVHYETINERHTKTFTSEKKANEYINNSKTK